MQELVDRKSEMYHGDLAGASVLRGVNSLKIKIVPDITTGAGLNGENFDCSLGGELEKWFATYRDTWNTYKRTPQVIKQSLRGVLLNDAEPLKLALKFFAICPGCNHIRTKSLPLFILETVCELHSEKPTIAETCDDNTRMVAFNFVKTCGISPLYKAVIETFEVYKINEMLVPKLRDLISEGYYKDVAFWSMHLGLTGVFGMFDIVFPLILQDKFTLAEDYLMVAKDQQIPFVEFLDSLLDKQKTVSEQCDHILNEHKFIDVKLNILSHRPMSKLVARLAKKYNLADHHTPNMKFSKSCSFIHYMYTKFKNGSMSSDAWREIVRDTATSQALQLDMISYIVFHSDMDEAIYWVKHYKIPMADCPVTIQDKFQQDHGLGAQVADTMADTIDAPLAGVIQKPKSAITSRDEFLTIELPADAIILVEDKPKFLKMLDYLEAQKTIAFDSEWKPSMSSNNCVSLLQLATMERVYLVDCVSLQFHDDLWSMLGQKIFNNLEILKMGFSLNCDLRALDNSLPLLLNPQVTVCYLDLRDMFCRLKCMQIVNYPFGHVSNFGESLSALTELCLGKKLDKSNQCSNWANRPLREEQITYAALDAYSLLQIYQVFGKVLKVDGIDINRVVDEITTARTTKNVFGKERNAVPRSKPRDKVDYISNFQCPRGQRVYDRNSVSEIQFVCDYVFNGLSTELRKVGINCVDVVSDYFSYYIDLAKRDRCYIITKWSRKNCFWPQVRYTKLFFVNSDEVAEQVLEVLYYYQIDVTQSTLYSRCLECNSNEFILIWQDDVRFMHYGEEGDCEQRRQIDKNINFNKTFQLLNVNEHIIRTKTTHRGARIKLEDITVQALTNKEHFYVCDRCGACTWDGKTMICSSIINKIFP